MNTMQPRPPTVPVRLAGAMLQQSNARVQGLRDMMMKFQRALHDMQAECQSLAIASQFNPVTVQNLTLGQTAVMHASQQVLYALEQAAQTELHVQGELKRWMGGFPPSAMPQAPPPQAPQAPPAQGPQAAPVITTPVQQAPIGQVPPTGPLPVVTFDSPAAAKAAVEASNANGTTPVITPAPVPAPAAVQAPKAVS